MQVRERTAALGEANQRLIDEVRERKASEALIHALLDASTHIALLLDPAGTVLAINQMGAEHLGKPSEELVGQNLRDGLPEAAIAPHLATMDEALTVARNWIRVIIQKKNN